MPQNFIGPQRDQLLLLPQDMREWLPEGDLAYFVVDVVAELDLSKLYARYRANGQGAAAFDPGMMLALVVYAHMSRVFSSRAIERACTRDAGFRVVTGGLVPDHSTITRFIAANKDVVKDLFVQVLKLCRQLGMVRAGVIAVDGTKIAANASFAKSYTAAALEHQLTEAEAELAAADAALAGQVQLMLDEHQAQDADEDARFGAAKRGDELPAELARAGARRDKIKAAQADLAAREQTARQGMLERQKAKQQAWDEAVAKDQAEGRPRRPGPRPADEVSYRPPGGAKTPPRANLTDPDSRRMKDKHGFTQGFNAQAAVTADQIVLDCFVTQDGTDHHQLPVMLDSLETTLPAAGIAAPGTVLADAGYANEATFAAVTAHGAVLLAPLVSDEKRALGQDTDGGQDLSARPATAAAQRQLATDEGKALYALRGRTVEPVFGHLKDRGGLRRFRRRGLDAVKAEFVFGCLIHNLHKIHATGWTPTTGPAPATA